MSNICKLLILLSLTLCIGAGANAQDTKKGYIFVPSGKDHLYRGFYNTVVAKGDLNKDGVKDMVIAELLNGEFHEEQLTRFAIYFGGRDGVYNLHKAFYFDGYARNAEVSVTNKGVLRMAVKMVNDSIGDTPFDGFTKSYYLVYMFRFQDGEFHLIGGKNKYRYEQHPDKECESYEITYNMLTNKAIKNIFVGCDTTKPESSDLEMDPQPLMKITDFVIGEIIFDKFVLKSN